MEVRPVDKLILLMLTEIYDALKISNREVDPKFVRAALFGDHFWAFDWKMGGLLGGEPDSDQLPKDISNILDMHGFLERSFDNLSKADQDKIEHSFLLRFHGFDGNNETEYMAAARFMVQEMGLFSDFNGRDFNSHSPTLRRSLAMYRAFEPIRARLADRDEYLLTLDELQEILAAARDL